MTTQDIDLGVVARGPQGPKGDKGDVGPAPTLKIGTVTKLNPDQTPTADFTGDNGTYTLNIGIPQGVQGETNKTATNALNLANSVNNRLWSIQTNSGGRNLLPGTRDFKQWGTSISKVAVTNGQETFQAVTGTESSSAKYYDIVNFWNLPLEKDTDYTASFWVKTSEKTDIWSFLYDSGSNGNYADGATKSQSTTDYTRVVVRFHNGNNTATPSFIPVRINKKSTITVWLYGCMLEKGTVAHDWSPAPEDIQSEVDANSTAINNVKTAAANAQSSANSAQGTANTAIKASETLKDLGNYTATASGTTANSPTTGLPRTSGVSMSEVYDNGYPTTYGNVLNVAGAGSGQLLLGWSGNDNTTEHLWYRSHRDTSTGGWGTWQKIAYVSDLTWSNISGKPDVATKSDVSSALTVANTAKSTADSALSKANSNATALNNKANKSDLTWANISDKPSIPDADATTTVSSGDLNNYTTTGKYYMPNALSNYTNHPTTGTDMGNLFVMKVDAYHSGDMIVQTIYQINTGDVWIRQRWDSVWKSWRQINFWS